MSHRGITATLRGRHASNSSKDLIISTFLLRAGAVLLGILLIRAVLLSAIRTFVLPRGVEDTLSRRAFYITRKVFDFRATKAKTYLERDSIMALYAPVALFTLPVIWLSIVMVGYMAIFWSLRERGPLDALSVSGSSLLTLGFDSGDTGGQITLTFTEAAIGLLLAAILIAYLPAMYSAWSRREALVALLEVRAGSPPSAQEFIVRFQRLRRLDRINEIWPVWETWFIDVEESHTSLGALTFFRSPQPDRSWITAAGTVLDTAALFTSTIDIVTDVEAQLCLRAGYIALRRIATYFRLPFDPDPRYPIHPVAVTREEYDEVVEDLASNGVPIKADREQAWLDFAGWRVTYEVPLLRLARLTMAPYAQWSSDRSLPGARR
jgi:hypothetical protein